MSALIRKVIGLWKGADGKTAEVGYEGTDRDHPKRWEDVDSLTPPRFQYRMAIELADGNRILLPTDQIADILPDGTGVLVVFDAGNREASIDLVKFPPPPRATQPSSMPMARSASNSRTHGASTAVSAQCFTTICPTGASS